MARVLDETVTLPGHALLALLRCPGCRRDLALGAAHVRCEGCERRFPVVDGIVSFLDAEAMEDTDRAELASRDDEATWYDTIFSDYINTVEVRSTLARIAQPVGPILDFGAGTGRLTTVLAHDAAQPVIAVDYSIEQLRRLVPRCAGREVLVVHADGRALPIKDGVLVAAVAAEVYEHFRPADRATVLAELHRVLIPGAPLSISTLSYNLVYRLWKLRGNTGAKEGEHLLGGHFYYVRQTAAEFRRELSAVFDVEEVVGIRNIPVRTIAGALRRLNGRLGDRFESVMTARGHVLDRAIERLPVSPLTGFFLLARARRRA